MTVCNMTIEGGGRAGMIAPDETTFEWVEGRPGAPADFDAAVEPGASCRPTTGASFDQRGRGRRRRRSRRWSPGARTRRRSPRSPDAVPEPSDDTRASAALRYMDLEPGTRDRRRSSSTASSSAPAPTRASATSARPRRWSRAARSPSTSSAMVVPGLAQVKAQAEAEGLDEVFRDAGFDWRSAGLLDVPGHEPGHR